MANNEVQIEGPFTKDELFRLEALVQAARVHEGEGTNSPTVLVMANKFEDYLKTGRAPR